MELLGEVLATVDLVLWMWLYATVRGDFANPVIFTYDGPTA